MKRNITKLRQRAFTALLLLFIGISIASAQRTINLNLQNEPLPSALKKIERAGGKSILFTYEKAGNYKVSAYLRKSTEKEAITTVLRNKPFECIDRKDYFVIRYTGKNEQSLLVHGIVKDEKGHPLAFANVLLEDASTHGYITGCITGDDGSFVLPSSNAGTGILKVSYIGYKSVTVTCRENNEIHLQSDVRLLKEVKVTSSHPLVERRNNGIVANVQGTALSMMGSASDMVSHLPLVTGSDGDYKVIGRGTPEIYINGRKVRDNNELDRLQANEVLSAEIITSPGVRYAADVPAVIRLKTIRKHGQGLSGSFFAQYSQGRKARGNEGIAFNYRTGGLDIFAKGYFNEYGIYYTDNESLKLWDKDTWENVSQSVVNGKKARFNGEIGFNYEVNDHQSFGLRYAPEKSLIRQQFNQSGITSVYKNGNAADYLNFDTQSPSSGWGHSLNAYYTGDFGKWNIDFNADYYKVQSNSDQLARNDGRPSLRHLIKTSVTCMPPNLWPP